MNTIVRPLILAFVLNPLAGFAAAQQPDQEQPCPACANLCFVPAVATLVYQDKDTASARIATLVPGEAVAVYSLDAFFVTTTLPQKSGWIRVGTMKKPANVIGWINTADKDGVLQESWLDARVRVVPMEKESWPVATKIDIARGRVRVGFSEQQVRAALGSPVRQQVEETSTGTTTTWTLARRIVVFKAGKVVSVTTIG